MAKAEEDNGMGWGFGVFKALDSRSEEVQEKMADKVQHIPSTRASLSIPAWEGLANTEH